MPREQLEELRLRKLQGPRRLELEQRAVARAAPPRGGRRAGTIWSLDDLRRIPFMTATSGCRASSTSRRSDRSSRSRPRAAIRYHLTSGTTGKTPIRGPRLDEGLGVDRRDVVLRLLGLRRPARRHASSSPSATARSSASGARTTPCEKIGCLVLPGGNMTTEARVQADRRHGRDRRLLDADLRAADGAGGADARHRPRQRPGQAADPLGRAGRLDPRDEEADRGAVGREGRRHRGHDRARHDHDVRVRRTSPAARTSSRTTTSRRSSTPRPASRSPTASRASASSPRSAAASSRCSATARATSSLKVPGDRRARAAGPSTSTRAASAGRVDDMKLVRGTNVYPRAVEAIVREYDGDRRVPDPPLHGRGDPRRDRGARRDPRLRRRRATRSCTSSARARRGARGTALRRPAGRARVAAALRAEGQARGRRADRLGSEGERKET